ncbi:hypothetical protein FQR65_LT08686 [Abscondita terminalis]|nr:hypothetical protein FQR65_LT08686 [Abscondita terminalis]
MRVLETEAHKMKLLHLVVTLVLLWDVSCSGVTIGLNPCSHPIQSLYHGQDIFGQYAYGYITPTSSKSESKTVDGVTHGGYSYLDSNGIIQTVKYVADPLHGFRVLATNLPQDSPDVARAKAEHLLQFQATQAERESIAAQVVTSPGVVSVVAPVQDLPEVAQAKAQHLAQFQATQAEHAAISAHIASAPVVVPAVAPVQDLPEVALAKAQHLAQFNAIQAENAVIATTHLTAPATVPVVPAPVQDLPEVIKARAEHLAEVEATKARDISIAAERAAYVPHVAYSYVPAVALHAPVSSQYHTQDAIGQYSYGYVSPLSSKSELKTADGITRGGYSYIDANGIVQTINYVSDPVHGFRVAGTNLPAAPQVVLKGASSSAHVLGAVAPVSNVLVSDVVVSEPVAKPVWYVPNAPC